ncbi:MAG: dihydrofolate reductase [bacterium]|nr:dihydrofolate reductase [bacterium]
MSTLPPLALIVCRARNGVIGAHGSLPWNIPEDRAHFRSLTLGHSLIFGRHTFQSLPKPLDRRRIIVLSRDPAFTPTNCLVARSLDEALTAARLTDPCPIVCGGAQVYSQTLPLATLIYLTQLHFDAVGDTFFPELDPSQWHLIDERPQPHFTFRTLARL